MALIRKSELYPEWTGFFNDFFNKDFFDWNNRHFSDTNTTIPPVNIKSSDDAFTVEMAVPGMKKEDFNIELNNQLLTISSEKKEESETKEGKQFTKREFSFQSFSRSFTLPENVDEGKIEAKYESGILKLIIPIEEKAKPKGKKQIAIK